jgi:hypothetical protein
MRQSKKAGSSSKGVTAESSKSASANSDKATKTPQKNVKSATHTQDSKGTKSAQKSGK